MKPVRVLDPGHILTVCTHAAHDTSEPADERGLPKIAVTATEEAVTIRIAADAARVATILGALHRAGYDATADGDAITVHGWSPARLSRRIARLDAAVQWLTEQLAFTARTAVALYQAGTDDHALTIRAARDTARHQVVRNLRSLIEHQVGPFTSHDQRGEPADPHAGMLLRQCRWLEDDIDLLLSRHRAIATQAIAEHRLDTEHRAQTAPVRTVQAQADPAVQPAAVAAHDAPTAATANGETGGPPAPTPSSTEPGRDVRAATSPARHGA